MKEGIVCHLHYHTVILHIILHQEPTQLCIYSISTCLLNLNDVTDYIVNAEEWFELFQQPSLPPLVFFGQHYNTGGFDTNDISRPGGIEEEDDYLDCCAGWMCYVLRPFLFSPPNRRHHRHCGFCCCKRRKRTTYTSVEENVLEEDQEGEERRTCCYILSL